jgi:hypothetical protein
MTTNKKLTPLSPSPCLTARRRFCADRQEAHCSRSPLT